MIITIDGPAGSGKSSVAKELANKLGIYYLNTGFLYRAIAFVWLELGQGLEDIEKIKESDLSFIEKIKYEYEDKKAKVLFGDKDITAQLADMVLSKPASILSAKKEIRNRLLDLQRSISEKYDIVAEGRDCGSIVFPNADYKFYLTASLEVRARRVMLDSSRKDSRVIDTGQDLEKVKVELEKRDERDKTREVAPLIIPKDAIVIDNSDLDLNQTIEKFLSYIRVDR